MGFKCNFLQKRIYGQNAQKLICQLQFCAIKFHLALKWSYYRAFLGTLVPSIFLCNSKLIVPTDIYKWPFLSLFPVFIYQFVTISQYMKTAYQKVTNTYSTYPLALARHSICSVTIVERRNTHAYTTSQNWWI